MKLSLRATDPKILEDPEVKKWLSELDAALEDNPLLAYNNPEFLPAERIHRKQLDFHAIRPPTLGIKALIAGNRSGKTIGCVVDDIVQAVDEEVVPAHLKSCKKWQPPFHVWVGAPKFAKHEDTILPLLRKFIPRSQLLEGSFDKSYKSQARLLRLVNGSTFGLKTYDQDLDAWASAEVHRVHWDEEPNIENSVELRSEARARLISTGGEEIIGMTPLLGWSWVHDEVWLRRHEDRIAVVQMTMEDNPWNSAEAIAEFAAGLTEEEKRARLEGEFVHFGGLFFDEFRQSLHVVAPPEPQSLREQHVVVGIDPGLDHPTGITWTAFDSENAALTFDEFRQRNMVVPDIAAEIKRRNVRWGIEPVAYVIDPSARNRSAINADQVEAAYGREEIYCQHGQNDRAAGILEMKRRLQATQPNGTPSPTWLISRDCPLLIKEVERYRRDPKSKSEWDAIKEEDDLCDAARYSILSRAWSIPELASRPQRSYGPNFEPPFTPPQPEVGPMGPWS